jgi:hypothetical protein
MESFSWTLSFAWGVVNMLALVLLERWVRGKSIGAYYDSRRGRHGGDCVTVLVEHELVVLCDNGGSLAKNVK